MSARTQNPSSLVGGHPGHLRHLSMFYEPSEIEIGAGAGGDKDNRVLLESYFAESDKTLEVLLTPKYINIKQLYIEFNTQLLSSASSERLFSLGKHILTYSRTSLGDGKFEKLAILSSSAKRSKQVKI